MLRSNVQSNVNINRIICFWSCQRWTLTLKSRIHSTTPQFTEPQKDERAADTEQLFKKTEKREK